ncbi:anti-sigma factor [Streptomyces xanthii]|uniref:Regulator of SigK n=1 Tax=Streptomyces xanthii TaxID=2768069 RepID=A0A7H1BHV9_9ACTN|nr:anti-sigma factor [Streptomyces xanthii]QNS08314.1 anti-sigma factor [Streptomyces xanthii]
MSTADLHTLTGAYALHALPDEERAAFERHLAECEACRDETAELTATAARLGLAATTTPSPALREEVLRRITTVRQEQPGAPRSERIARGLRWRQASRWALAACLAAAAALGGTAVWQHERAQDATEQARQAQQDNQHIAEVLSASDAKSLATELADGASGTVVVSHERDRAVFLASDMARPPRGKVYQLWFDDSGTMRPAGLMDTARTDQAVLLDGAVDGASGIGITVEPAGGSEHPTSAPIALMKLPA